MEWQEYAIPLGPGINNVLPQDDQLPMPTRMRGLLPGAGRLFSFQEARRVLHQLEHAIQPGARTIGFDHLGMYASELRASGQVRFYLRNQLVGSAGSEGWADSVNYPSPAFFEQAGLSGEADPDATGADLVHQFLDAVDGTSSEHTPGNPLLVWSSSVADTAGGSLDEGRTQFTSVGIFTAVVRCVRTNAGMMGVGVDIRSDSATLSTNKSFTLTITQTDALSAHYLVYAMFAFTDGGTPATKENTDWLLVAALDGPGTAVISRVPIGETLPGNGQGGYLLSPYPGSTAVRHQGRYFGISGFVESLSTDRVVADVVAAPMTYRSSLGSVMSLPPGRAVVYSSGLSVANMGTHTTHFTPQLSSSTRITALASSPAGLLIFGDNEVLVARGNPDSTDFRVEQVSTTVGCDEGVIPARLGGVIFTVHRGRVWAVNLGPGTEGITDVLTDISAKMRAPDLVVTIGALGPNPVIANRSGGFVDVRADARHSQIVAQRNYNYSRDGAVQLLQQVYRFDLRTGEWFDDPIALNGGWFTAGPGITAATKWELLPCGDEYGLRYYPLFAVSGGEDDFTHAPRYLVGRQGGTFDLEYRDIDCGSPRVSKQFRRVHLFARGFGVIADASMRIEAIDFLNDAARQGEAVNTRFYYRVEQDGRDPTSEAWIESTAQVIVASRRHFIFNLPEGVVGRSLSLRIEGQLFSDTAGNVYPGPTPLNEGRFLSAQYSYLDSPLIVEYAPRREQRYVSG